MTPLFLSIMLACTLLATNIQAKGPSMFGLRIEGNKIINEDGQTIRLLGINRAGFEFSCLYGALGDGPMDKSSLNYMLEWNINHVRVPLNAKCWLGLNGQAPASGSGYINAVKAYVDLLTSHGLAVVLDLHWTAPGTETAKEQIQMPDEDHAPAFWTSVATMFQTYSNVIFDAYNEPFPFNNVWDSDEAWLCWRDGGDSTCQLPYKAAGMQTLVNTIRQTGATNIINVNGIGKSNSLAQWLSYKPTDPLSSIMAGSHLYNLAFYCPCNNASCWNSTILPISFEYPVYLGEIGQTNCQSDYVTEVMLWADANQINYAAWTWNTWDCAQGPALISDYSGTPTPFGSAVRSHLLSLGEIGPGQSNGSTVRGSLLFIISFCLCFILIVQ